MKDKILVFIIGILIGAIITSLVFLIYSKLNPVQLPAQNGNRPEFKDFVPEDGQNAQMPNDVQMPNGGGKQFKNKKSNGEICYNSQPSCKMT